jgi:diguanylate cyclase (GGDEF)-like protein
MQTDTLLFDSKEQLVQFCKEHTIVDNTSLMIQVLTDIAQYDAIASLQNLLDELFPTSAIIGTSTNGAIMDGKVIDKTVIIFSQFQKSHLSTTLIEHQNNNHYQTGKAIADDLVTDQTKVIITFSDGLYTNGEEYLKGIEAIAPHITIAGGMAGDNSQLIETFVFDNRRIINNGAVAIAIDNPNLIVNSNYSFNWLPIGKKMMVTRSVKNRVYEIDHQPAYQIYSKYLGEELSKRLLKSGIEFPLTFERNGVTVGRAVLEFRPDGSLLFAGNIDEGTQVRFGIGQVDLILQDSIGNVNYFNGKAVESIFIYSCIGRYSFIGDGIEAELKPFAKIAPTAGFFTNGEFFYRDGQTQFLNQTLTILALSESTQTIHTNIPTYHQDEHTLHTRSDALLALAHLANLVTHELEGFNRELEHLVEQKTQYITQQAYIDDLTHLPNRLQLLDDIQKQANHYLLLINVDDFTSINDYFGHECGDYLLMTLVDWLTEFRDQYFGEIYKLPSDEYAVLLDRVMDREQLKEYIQALLAFIEKSIFEYQSHPLQISITIGAAQLNQNRDGMRHANIALKHAKHQKVPYIIFEETVALPEMIKKNLEMAQRVRLAINHHKIIPFYQPIVDLKSDQIYGYEALARLSDDKSSYLISPNQFIPTAQKIKLYWRITQMIFDQVITKVQHSQRNFSINLAFEDILNHSTRTYLLSTLAQNAKISHCITFEILETQEIKEDEIVNQFIQEVQNLGAKIAIDDFGSGFANFQNLTRIHANFIKIDGSLIRTIDQDPNSRLVVETIVNFAQKMQMKTVAEFIHSKEILDSVKEMGIDYGQGYYLGSPSKDIEIE